MTEDTADPRHPDPRHPDPADPADAPAPARPQPRADGQAAAAAPGALGFVPRLRVDWWWIAILALCGGFQIYRGAPVDGVLFLVAAAALTADAACWLSRFDRYPLPRVALAVQLALGLVVVAIVAFTPQFSAADLVVVSLVGLASIVTAWRGEDRLADEPWEPRQARAPMPGGPAERHAALRRALRRSAVLWAAGGVVLCLWELAAFFLALPSAQATYEHPPLTDLVEPLLATPAWRAITAALWLLAGAALLQRGRRR
jgi:hypothetical protein